MEYEALHDGGATLPLSCLVEVNIYIYISIKETSQKKIHMYFFLYIKNLNIVILTKIKKLTD